SDATALSGLPRLRGDADRTPRVRAAHRVSPLNMNNGDIRVHSANVDEPVVDSEVRVGAEDLAAQQRAGRQARHIPSRRPQGQRDREVCVVVNLKRSRYAALSRAAVAMAESLRGIAHPGGGDAAHAACPDELVEQGVRDGADQLEVPTSLA